MLLLRLWNYIRGYVIILVEGYFLEKFINICIHRQVFLWDIKRLKSSSMRLKVSIKGFKMLRSIAKKTGCRIRIEGKRGLPFALNRYRRRKAFMWGAIAFVFILYTLTAFVWTVEVSGNKSLDTVFLLDKLQSLGVKQGALKYGINPDKIANNMMIEIKELAWIGIIVKGTKIKVEVAERKEPPVLIPKDEPCHIVAARDGIVKSVVAKAGQDMVKAGDTVIKGQVLISGKVQNKYEEMGSTLVHALGFVKARTWYEERVDVATTLTEIKKTGNKKDFYTLVVLTKSLALPKGKMPFENHTRVEIRKRLSLGRDLELPFELVIERFYENSIVEREIGIDEAKQAAMDEAHSKALKAIPHRAEIINTTFEYLEGEGGLFARVTIECNEDIGVAKRIGG